MRQKSVLMVDIRSLLRLPYCASTWPLTGIGNSTGGVAGDHGSRMNLITWKSKRSTFASILIVGLLRSAIVMRKAIGEPSSNDDGRLIAMDRPVNTIVAPRIFIGARRNPNCTEPVLITSLPFASSLPEREGSG